ncbi:hypothetical protein C8T65DRAFT_816547 [Cerioporus squamosus]|nr:hypothetical protein C8T65DRAFT_816547 [Cerioporus squamosus]
MVTYPIVASGGSQTIVPSQQFVRQSGAAVNANRRPPSQLMAHPNYSHYAIYHDMTTALGITIGTPFQTPRQQISPLPPQSADPVPVGGAYASTRSDPYLAPPAAPHFDDAAVPVHRHARNSSNCSSVTPVEQHIATPWDPKWDSFRLDVWRKDKHESIEVKPGWDDEDLVRELKKTYDRLRSWRRLLSLKGPRYITPVHWQGDESFIYPQRIGPARITAHRTLRTQYLLKHPERVRGKRELMLALTKRADVGIEFVEQWQVWRVAFLVFMLAFLSMVIAIVTSIKLNDWSTGFAIGGFFAQMFAVILVAIGFVHYEEL